VTAYAIGIMATYRFIERLAGFAARMRRNARVPIMLGLSARARIV
jgi:hypothetical protein